MQAVHFWDTRFYADHLMLSSHHTLVVCFHRHLQWVAMTARSLVLKPSQVVS
jgi:hypothetical protein